jgi:hypothetical protein
VLQSGEDGENGSLALGIGEERDGRGVVEGGNPGSEPG